MNNHLVFGFLIVGSISCYCQSENNTCGFSTKNGWSNALPSSNNLREVFVDDPSGVPEVVAEIEQALHFDADIDIFLADGINNAYATIANGKRELIIDVGFLENCNQQISNNWFGISVIAHEIGHHIAGFSDDRHYNELSADYWSGQVLQRLGASLESSMKGMRKFGGESDVQSHPSKYRRMKSIQHGFEDAKAGRIDYTMCLNCK